MIVVLSRDTIVRILDHATTSPGAASEARPALAENIISALNEAKKNKASIVGPIEPSQLNALSAWCRSVGLIAEGEIVEAAVRASG
jgi:hypothetical protein